MRPAGKLAIRVTVGDPALPWSRCLFTGLDAQQASFLEALVRAGRRGDAVALHLEREDGSESLVHSWPARDAAPPPPRPPATGASVAAAARALRRKVRARVAELGATLDSEGGRLAIEAPEGKVWSGLDIHEIVTDWGGALEEMSMGVEACTAADCDWCREAAGEI